MKKVVLEIPPEKFQLIKLPRSKTSPRKIATQKILTWNITTHFI